MNNYYDDDYDYYDYEYESYREETGHITNFDKAQAPIYTAAIEVYKAKNPSTDLRVDKGYRWPGLMGLYGVEDNDLSDFWSIFDTVKKEKP